MSAAYRLIGYCSVVALVSTWALMSMSDGVDASAFHTNHTTNHTSARDLEATDNAKNAGSSPIAIRKFIGEPTDTACYRMTVSPDPDSKKCPQGYVGPTVKKCWAECPIEYPVQCGFECVPQGSTCREAMLAKGEAIAAVVGNYLSAGLYSVIAREIKQWRDCARTVQPLIETVGDLVKKEKTTTAKTVTKQVGSQIAPVLRKCLDIDVAVMAKEAANELLTAVVDEIIAWVESDMDNKIDSDGVKTLFATVLPQGTTEDKKKRHVLRVAALNKQARLPKQPRVTKLGVRRKSSSNENQCGKGLMTVISAIADNVKKFPEGTRREKIKATISSSDDVLQRVPDAVFNCVGVEKPQWYSKALTAIFSMLDKIVDQMIEQRLTKSEAGALFLDHALDAISKFDPTGLADLAQAFVQPVCGPTIFTQTIKFGSADETVGLKTKGYAFHGSTGEWKKPAAGKGAVSIELANSDSKKVTVYVMSAGLTIDEFQVDSKKTATWDSKAIEAEKGISLKGKTLHIVRERVKNWAFDELKGGSLLVWVPKDSGHLDLEVKITPPKVVVKT